MADISNMMKWSLPRLLSGLHQDIQSRLNIARKAFVHPSTKGDASQKVWLELFQNYLPKRYQAESAHVVDSDGNFSEQIDIVIFDRQYSPFIFMHEGQIIVPAESIYAVFEAKQSINAQQIEYAKGKIASVRRLVRTSLPIPHAGGTYAAKPPFAIYGGILTFESDWRPPLGTPLVQALENDNVVSGELDMGCIAAHGTFFWDRRAKSYTISVSTKAATGFLFRLISELQFSGTVPMIDIEAYSRWLSEE